MKSLVYLQEVLPSLSYEYLFGYTIEVGRCRPVVNNSGPRCACMYAGAPLIDELPMTEFLGDIPLNL